MDASVTYPSGFWNEATELGLKTVENKISFVHIIWISESMDLEGTSKAQATVSNVLMATVYSKFPPVQESSSPIPVSKPVNIRHYQSQTV